MNLREFKNTIRRNFVKYYGMVNKIEKKIVFSSYTGRQYSDNPRVISEKMHELYPDYKIVWGLNCIENTYGIIPNYVEIVSTKSISFHMHIATACCFIQNEGMSLGLYKRKGQFFIQTWHGDRGIKKILYDSIMARNVDKKLDLADEYLTDLFVVGSDYAENRIKTAFRYLGNVIKVGMPRNDKLVYPIDMNLVKQRIGIELDKKILLYAPTLRRNTKIVNSMVDLNETLEKLEEKGDNWVCLVRAHPKSIGVEVEKCKNMLDVSKYPDMSDLLMISDMLITDYSSCAGDFILRHKPIILAQFDLEQYMKEDRTFYVDINEIGYLIARNQEELNHIIETKSEQDYANNCEEILAYFGTKETGKSAEQICHIINNWYVSICCGGK